MVKGGEYASYSGYMGAMRNEWKHQDAEELGKQSKYEGLRHYIAPTSWSAVLYPPPGQVGRVEPHFDPNFRSPLILMHGFGSEVEAALASDLARLWQRLHAPGSTPAKLAAARWNLPKLKLWQQPSLVKALAGTDDPKKAQTKIRGQVRNWLPRLPRGLLPKEQQARVAREEAEQKKKAAEKKERERQQAEQSRQFLQQLAAAEAAARAAIAATVLGKRKDGGRKAPAPAPAKKWRDAAAEVEEGRKAAAAKAAQQAKERDQRIARRGGRRRLDTKALP